VASAQHQKQIYKEKLKPKTE